MLKNHTKGVFLAAIGTLLTATTVQAAPIAPAAIPAAAMATIKWAAPSANWSSATMFTQFPGTAFQRTIYEADGTYPNGTAVDVEVTDTGVMVEYEEGIKMAKVPANVQAALKSNFPTLAKISEIEWVMKPMVGNGGKLVNSI